MMRALKLTILRGAQIGLVCLVWACTTCRASGGRLEIAIRPESEAGGLNVISPHGPGDLFDFRTCEGVVVGSNDFGLFQVKLPSTFGDGQKSWRRAGQTWSYSWPYAQGVTVHVEVEPENDSLKLEYTLQNTGSHALDAVQLHTCIPTTEAPGFFPPAAIQQRQTNWSELYDRLHLWSAGRDFTVGATKLAATEPHLSLMRKGAEPVRWGWWVNGPETFDLPLVALTSRDGRATVALAFEQAVWASANTGDDRACFHLFPWFGRIEPGQTVTVKGRLYVLRGNPRDALERFQRDFPEHARRFDSALSDSQTHRSQGASKTTARSSARRPNIIWIMADDLGYGDIGPFGQRKIRTPNLDRLAAAGTCFDQFYPGAAICSPTRCVLMTGLHTGHARIRGNHGRAGLPRVPLLAEDVTVAEVLKSAGYATMLAGKWGLGEPDTTGIPNRQGFDLWFGYLNNDLAEFYFPEKIWRNEEEIPLPGNRDGKRGQYSNDLMTEEALRFIDIHRQQPFFVYLAYTIPHNLLEVPEDSLAEYAGVFPESAPVTKNGQLITATPRATFAAMVTRLDREVGRVLDGLDALGLQQDTVVFFCSDNGAPDRGGLARFFGSNGPLRGNKGSLLEGGLRTPMIVRWPGKVRAGQRSSFVWGGWDFLPTAAALAGVEPPPGLDGINVVPALLGEPIVRDEALYWEDFQGGRLAQAVRLGYRKALRQHRDAPVEVYDLNADPGETRNLATEQPAFVARARELFRTERTESEHWPLDP